jgi:hypothetical protein
MPFRSEAQRRYLYANEPEVARRWQKKTPKGTKLPDKVGKARECIVAKMVDPDPDPSIVIPSKAIDGTQPHTALLHTLHTLHFSKRAFLKKRAVRVWLKMHGYRMAHVADEGECWSVRQDPKVKVGNLGEQRLAVAPGVEATVGLPHMPPREGVAKGVSPVPLMPPIGGASGPSNHTPEMPDFRSLYGSPESTGRQKKEAEQSRDRRRSLWRDFNFAGFHGIGAPDKPTLRYLDGETSTADMAVQQARQKHYLTREQLQQHQKRVQEGTLGYEVVQGQTGKRKKGKV